VADTMTIETDDLRKRYGATEALRGLSLQVPPGSICGFLGKNGAGKTTTIKILLGMSRASSGTARVFGLDAGDEAASVAIRQRTAFVGEEKDLPDFMTVAELTRFTASFYPSWRTDLEAKYRHRFELPAEQKVKTLSKGTRTKVALLLALCRGVELLVLDEPTSGLDPAVSEDVLKALVAFTAEADATIFFSSHQIPEIDQIADRVIVIDRGRAVVAGALDDLREHYRRVNLVFDGDAPAVSLRSPGVVRARREGRVLSVLSSAGTADLIAEARTLGATATDEGPVTLKELFLESVEN
jgi:ABC-2 type transport system ATP-binding protein